MSSSGVLITLDCCCVSNWKVYVSIRSITSIFSLVRCATLLLLNIDCCTAFSLKRKHISVSISVAICTLGQMHTAIGIFTVYFVILVKLYYSGNFLCKISKPC